MKKKLMFLALFLLIPFILSSCTNSANRKSPIVKIDDNGIWAVSYDDGTTWESLNVRARGTDGVTPEVTIGSNGNWFINGTDTNIYAGDRVNPYTDDSVNTIAKLDVVYEVNGVIKESTTDLERQEVLFNSSLPGIPFLSLSDITIIKNLDAETIYTDNDTGETVTLDTAATCEIKDGIGTYSVTYPSGVVQSLSLDSKNQTMSFRNCGFMASNTYENNPLFNVSFGTTDGMNSTKPFEYIKVHDAAYVEGKILQLDLKNYENIKIIECNNDIYIPLQTATDIFDPVGRLYYVGGRLYKVNQTQGVATYDNFQYFITNIGQRMADAYNPTDIEKETLYKFSYDELCLVIDSKFGLKSDHRISSTDDFLSNVSIKEKMLRGEDGTALSDLIYRHMEDNGHTAFVAPGFTEGLDFEKFYRFSQTEYITMNKKDEYNSVRTQYNLADDKNKIINPIQIVDNTMYIMFDNFDMGKQDHYKKPNKISSFINKAPDLLTEEEKDVLRNDTCYLMSYAVHYANSNSNIENIVLDLSLNTGGFINCAVFVIGAFLGPEAFLYSENPFEESRCLTRYVVDTNFDGQFTDDDYFNNKRYFCLTSEISFSCGSIVPSVFKSSQRVKLLGQRTGGGSCVVYKTTTARGTAYNLSGPVRFYGYKNGMGENIEWGIEPNFYLPKTADFYDRESSNSYLKSLLAR